MTEFVRKSRNQCKGNKEILEQAIYIFDKLEDPICKLDMDDRMMIFVIEGYTNEDLTMYNEKDKA